MGKVLERTLEAIRAEKWDDALVFLHELLNSQMENHTTLFLMGLCHKMKGNHGLAYVLYSRVLEIKPDYFAAAINLTQIFREWGMFEEEKALLEECQRMSPESPEVLHNLSGMYLNNGTPDKAERHARYALKKLGDAPDTLVQLGLSLLEGEKFAEGFDTLDKALALGERKTRNFWSLGETPLWDGTPGQNVVVYGEQGHGDEIMFASCLNEAIALCNQVIIDTSKPDLVRIYERSFPDAVVLCTPDSQTQQSHLEHRIDAAIPFGSLPTLFRRQKSDFPKHDGYIVSHPGRRKEARRRLDELGPGLKIGLAWRGGIRRTGGEYRTIPLVDLAPILKQDAHFISVQYTPDAAEEAALQQDQTGVPIHHWQGAIDDFDMLTALIDELDLLITVPQTAAHQRAALGKECWIMVSAKPPWPFGMKRDDCIWYPNQTRIFRQMKGETWTAAIHQAAKALSKRTGSEVGQIIPARTIPDMEIRSVA